MNWRFYALGGPKTARPRALDGRLTREIWRPGALRIRPRNLPLWPFGIWWVFHLLHVFWNREYCLIVVRDGSRVIHRSCIFPRYFRFPFMAPDDLQIGDIWTDPKYRGLGVATYGIECAIEIATTSARRLWYIVEDSNAPSIHLIEKAGFVCVARGTRKRKLGIGLLGSFRPEAVQTGAVQSSGS